MQSRRAGGLLDACASHVYYLFPSKFSSFLIENLSAWVSFFFFFSLFADHVKEETAANCTECDLNMKCLSSTHATDTESSQYRVITHQPSPPPLRRHVSHGNFQVGVYIQCSPAGIPKAETYTHSYKPHGCTLFVSLQ